jgi:F5/8 type C domain
MAAHRYWRLNLIASASNAFSMSEIQFRVTAGVSLGFSGGTASAAQTFSSQVASLATDGNINTFYGSSDKVAPQWWAYDYGAGNSKDIVEIVITARNDASFNQAPSIFTPEWSDNGSTWTPMHYVIAPAWTSAGQVQIFAVTVAGATDVLATQAALEQWNASTHPAQVTQVALEQWTSVTTVTPPVGRPRRVQNVNYR